jgi:hypothetical protein
MHNKILIYKKIYNQIEIESYPNHNSYESR